MDKFGMMVEWHTGKELPKESKRYLVLSKYDFFASIPFSVKHQTWNAHDYETEEAAQGCAFEPKDIIAWADVDCRAVKRWMSKEE